MDHIGSPLLNYFITDFAVQLSVAESNDYVPPGKISLPNLSGQNLWVTYDANYAQWLHFVWAATQGVEWNYFTMANGDPSVDTTGENTLTIQIFNFA